MAEKDNTIAPPIYEFPRVLECRELDDKLLLQESYKRLNGNLAMVLHEPVLCGICLEKHLNLNQLNFKDSTKTVGSFTPERMMLEIFDNKVIRDLPSLYICDKCKEHVRQNYIFMHRVKNSSKILNSYIKQMNSQLDDVISYVESAPSRNEEVSNSVITLQNLVQVENDIILNEKPKAAKEYTFACDFCTSKFHTESAVKKHTRNLHSKVKKKIGGCLQCHERPCAHEKFLVSIREQKAKGAKVLRCPEPGCDYENRHGTPFILDHANAHHLNLKPHVCNACFKFYHTRKTLEGHKLSCLNKNCMYCDEKLGSVKLKLSHEADCKLISKSVKCQRCTDTFETETLLSSHHRRTHRRYKCTMCNSVCQSVAALKVHQLHAHNKGQQPQPCRRTTQTYKCFLCSKKFMNMTQVLEHQSQEHKNEKYECELCHKQFSERKIFLNHRSAHKQRESFKCDQCPFSSKSSMLLESHINSAHRHIRPHACQTCFKTFTTSKYLRLHEAKHTESKHQCPYCIALLAGGQKGLERHILRRHTETKPFSCKHCETQFAVKSDLDLHYIRKHGGEKRFVCPLCGLKHGTNGEMRAHITRTHAKGMVLDDFIMSHGTSHPLLLEIFKDRPLHALPVAGELFPVIRVINSIPKL